ncbi:MAG: methyl viologen-reducing hydrogenase [Deltaproteobacteria bacterium]|nr:methyl viologen-reducing hydrogenase [Deltaproteobacteria bacterium]
MVAKARVSIEWLSGCSGCEVGIVDLHEKLLAVLDNIELVRIPILMDTKDYVKADVGLITGSLRTEHDVEAAHKMREACDAIIAFGTCPVYGGPQSAAYCHSSEELLHNSFGNNRSTSTNSSPENVPKLLDGNRALDSEIKVDLYIPGCPPHPVYIFEGLTSLLQNKEPQIGRFNVCYHCDRTMVKTEQATLRRSHEGEYDPSICYLSQGCLCFGSATLDRCMAPCPRTSVPCFSCGGPSEAIILETNKDVRTMVAERMAHLTNIPYDTIVSEIERQAKTHYAYAMGSPIFREKPTFLLKKWLGSEQGQTQSRLRVVEDRTGGK